MIEVRLDIRAGGETHRTEWCPAGPSVHPDAVDADVVAEVRRDLDDRVLGGHGESPLVVLGDGTRRVIAARAIDWVDVSVRRRAK